VPAKRPDLPPALRALLDAATALVRRSSSGRVALARAADVVPADVLPRVMRPLTRTLRAAQEEACTPLTRKEVDGVLRSAWKQKPDKVLDGFDAEPLAVTPAAQVHRGERDGAPVAVKVLRPGLAASVRSDLALLDALAVPLRSAFPALDAGALLREGRETALDELDLEHEASTQRRVRRTLRGIDGLVVPAPDLSLCAEGVLVTELLEGPTLQSATPDDPGAVARAVVTAHVRAALDGLVLTDPRPGHVVLLAGGGIGLLGTGLARPVDRDRVRAALDALSALRDGDPRAFAEAVAGRLGVLPEDAALRAYEHIRELLGDLLLGPARLDGPALATAGEQALKRLGPLLEVAAQATPHREDLAVGRSVGQLAALLSALGATEDWGALVLAERDAAR
jgi:predicted unusual protein kinase regulating ubiquinone biosynthesis (AarF/ABC1/UbiB family)